ncbi:MAG: ChbG/HpnK family deacetylase [Candidatus Moranbacteria bacterium]|nr:ChbG/HpnK family deacetylase [Candidatus Moranbacteria bacterium]
MFQEKRKNLIITADDFGKSELANRNILKLARLGKIDRVSVMSGGIFAPGEIEELTETGVNLDIHFELEWQKKRRGKIKDNTARQGIVFLANHFRAGQGEKIREDWKKQIEKFREIIGQNPDGINSHEYVHLFPSYFRIAAGLSRQFEIPFIRFGKKGFRGKRNLAHLVLNNLRRWDKKYFLGSKLNSSEYFASLDWIGNINEFLKNIPEGKIEIACHPEREEEFELIEKYF